VRLPLWTFDPHPRRDTPLPTPHTPYWPYTARLHAVTILVTLLHLLHGCTCLPFTLHLVGLRYAAPRVHHHPFTVTARFATCACRSFTRTDRPHPFAYYDPHIPDVTGYRLHVATHADLDRCLRFTYTAYALRYDARYYYQQHSYTRYRIHATVARCRHYNLPGLRCSATPTLFIHAGWLDTLRGTFRSYLLHTIGLFSLLQLTTIGYRFRVHGITPFDTGCGSSRILAFVPCPIPIFGIGYRFTDITLHWIFIPHVPVVVFCCWWLTTRFAHLDSCRCIPTYVPYPICRTTRFTRIHTCRLLPTIYRGPPVTLHTVGRLVDTTGRCLRATRLLLDIYTDYGTLHPRTRFTLPSPLRVRGILIVADYLFRIPIAP